MTKTPTDILGDGFHQHGSRRQSCNERGCQKKVCGGYCIHILPAVLQFVPESHPHVRKSSVCDLLTGMFQTLIPLVHWFPTRMVGLHLDYISCLRYTILVGNPGHVRLAFRNHSAATNRKGFFFFFFLNNLLQYKHALKLSHALLITTHPLIGIDGIHFEQ